MQPSSSETLQDAVPPVMAEPTQPAQTPHLRIAHVLFMDIVGYSKLPMRVQAEVQGELRRLVEDTRDVRAARSTPGALVCRPTGDGMALIFFQDLLAPVRCALAVNASLTSQCAAFERRWGQSFTLRMGIHSGPVLCVEDINTQSDVAGEGIVFAQRVMDAGDAGHILLSKVVADAICRVDPFHRCLHDMGVFRAKHGQEIHLFNLYGRTPAGGAFGCAALPYKIGADAAQRLEEKRGKEARHEWRDLVVAMEQARGAQNALTMVLLTFALLGGGTAALCGISPTFRAFAASTMTQAGKLLASGVETFTSIANAPKAEPKPRTPPRENVPPRDAPAKLLKPAPRRAQASQTFQVARVRVPQFKDRTFTEAEQIARQRGIVLLVSENSQYADPISDLITRQSVSAGRSIAVGS